jgi:hypothetical protein
VHISLDDSKKSAIEFINMLKNHLATHSNWRELP